MDFTPCIHAKRHRLMPLVHAEASGPAAIGLDPFIDFNFENALSPSWISSDRISLNGAI
jgi:hypothetical protein